MNLDLRGLIEFPAEVVLESEADNNEYGIEGIGFRDLMTVRLNIQRVDNEYFCHGTVTAPIEQECSRCLNPFEKDLSGDLSFTVRTQDVKPARSYDEESEIFFVRSGEPVVELNEIIRQSLVLSLPLKPLCSQDCKGLCPNCGVNLNEETCECDDKETDERWEGLRGLLE
jgi:uncharacterized protein